MLNMFRYVFTALWLQLSIPESTKKGCSIYCFKKNNHYNHLYENVKYMFFPISFFARLPFPEPDYSDFLNKIVNPVKSKGSLFRQNNAVNKSLIYLC